MVLLLMRNPAISAHTSLKFLSRLFRRERPSLVIPIREEEGLEVLGNLLALNYDAPVADLFYAAAEKFRLLTATIHESDCEPSSVHVRLQAIEPLRYEEPWAEKMKSEGVGFRREPEIADSVADDAV
jgi:hypothetical protein